MLSASEKTVHDVEHAAERGKEGKEETGPSVAFPVKASSLPQVSPYFIILSGGLILFNKWILTERHFSFPLFLTAYHMLVAMIGTSILRYATNALGPDVGNLPKQVWLKAIIPLAILYAFSLVLSNIAYVHLSIPFVQMIKAATPVLLQLISLACGISKMDTTMSVILICISAGCITATMGEVWFDTIGLVCQAVAVAAEASRLLVMQVLLRDIRLNPLASLYYYAPTCLLCIAAIMTFAEGSAPFTAAVNLGWPILLANGLMAFALNVASVLLISSSGSMASTLSGVAKDIVLIGFSVTVMGASINTQQVFGYGVALAGLVAYKNKEAVAIHVAETVRIPQHVRADEQISAWTAEKSPARLRQSSSLLSTLLFPFQWQRNDDALPDCVDLTEPTSPRRSHTSIRKGARLLLLAVLMALVPLYYYV